MGKGKKRIMKEKGKYNYSNVNKKSYRESECLCVRHGIINFCFRAKLNENKQND